MSARRFIDKFDMDPSAVQSLPDNHPAMMQNRTLFPSTIVEASEDFSDRLLISGKNNRKLGEHVEKGHFKGYALYGLTLEERATCPSDCSIRGACYGNGMHLARRHRIDADGVFYTLLEDEIRTLLQAEPHGVLVRLHVLGDFPSIEYVGFWADMLADHPRLACYGYTHRRTRNWGGEDIGDLIDALKADFPDRFRIRWSGPTSRADGAVIIKTIPGRPRVEEGLVCPAQNETTACCATCALCWEPAARHDTIVFIKHGRKSDESAATEAMNPTPKQSDFAAAHKARLERLSGNRAPEQPVAKLAPIILREARPRPAVTATPKSVPTEARPIQAIELPAFFKTREINSAAPRVREVWPRDLLIEPKYQRDLSGKSMRLIKQILMRWDWAKYKPPVCAETEQGLFVIDGQHTAIAAATHPGIKQIPVMIVSASQLEQRADAFVSHNRDRLTMSSYQIFHAEVASGASEARLVLACAMRAGATIPRAQPDKYRARIGDIVAVEQTRKIFRTDKAEGLEHVLRIAVAAKLSPIPRVALRAIRMILKEPRFAELKARGDQAISDAIASIQNIDFASRTAAAETEQSQDRACAVLIESAAFGRVSEVA